MKRQFNEFAKYTTILIDSAKKQGLKTVSETKLPWKTKESSKIILMLAVLMCHCRTKSLKSKM
jgi:hypothetical protein